VTIPEVFRELILGFSAFAVGLAAYIAVSRLRSVTEDGWQLFYALAALGFAIVVALVAELVFKAPDIPPSWRGWFYITGLTLGGVGYLGIALDQRRHGKG
jgi:hypothetical protein